jgi:hypothetical protein
MPDVTDLIAWEVLILLLALFGIVVIQILTGAINARGLLEGTTSNGSRFVSAGRVQLLIATGVAAVQYLSQVLDHPQVFPDIPSSWLVLLGGSHVIYLGGKYSALHCHLHPGCPVWVSGLLGHRYRAHRLSRPVERKKR